jgi:hypothetical protein
MSLLLIQLRQHKFKVLKIVCARLYGIMKTLGDMFWQSREIIRPPTTMLSFLRAPLPPKTNRATQNPIPYQGGQSTLAFSQSGSEYLLRGTQPPFSKDDPSTMQPPVHFHLHFHLYQDEHFRVVSGACHLFRDTTARRWKTPRRGRPRRAEPPPWSPG